MTDTWEQVYAGRADSFRHYPNEELVRFMGRSVLASRSAAQRPACRVLEVGCGNGANLWALAAEGLSSYGLDVSAEGLKLARATLARRQVNAGLTQGDATLLPYRTSSFDLVYDVVSLQHLGFSLLTPAYEEILRLLRPGGYFFSCHMGAATWDHDHGGGSLVDRHTFANMGPEALFPALGTICLPEPDDLEALLSSVGFQSIEIEDVVKSYDGRTRHVQYLIVTCRS